MAEVGTGETQAGGEQFDLASGKGEDIAALALERWELFALSSMRKEGMCELVVLASVQGVKKGELTVLVQGQREENLAPLA